MSQSASHSTGAPPAAGYSANTLSVAMITVCVEGNAAEALMKATLRTPWAVEHLEFEQYISALLRPELSPEVKSAQTVLAVVDYDLDPEQALVTTAYLQRLFAGRIAVVALCQRPEADLLLRAMRAGCTEFLNKPLDAAQFQATLERLEQQWTVFLGEKTTSGQILSFFGVKGGVGTTTVALQLAVFLVLRRRKKVLLIDNHRDLGHVCLYLGLDGSRYHFEELIRNFSRLDSDLLRGFIATHKTGLDVLSSPDLHDELRSVDPEALQQTLEFLRGEYDFVVVDCETSLANLAVMNCSDVIYLVANGEVGAIRDLSRYVDDLIHKTHATDRLRVVINRYSSQTAVSIEHIEKAIRMPVDVRIINNYLECVAAANLGEPISPEQKSEYAAQFSAWADSLAGAGGVKPASKPGKKRLAFWR
jgi:pilus assembly protein CpaE